MESEILEVRVPIRDPKTGRGLGYTVKQVGRSVVERELSRQPRLPSWEGVTLHRPGDPDTHTTPEITPEEYAEILARRGEKGKKAAKKGPVPPAPGEDETVTE